jgi:hypothetical protein
MCTRSKPLGRGIKYKGNLYCQIFGVVGVPLNLLSQFFGTIFRLLLDCLFDLFWWFPWS